MIAIQQQTAERSIRQASPRRQFPVRHPRLHHTTIDGVTYKVADCREEREAAFRLVYGAYVEAGLIPRNASQMRVTLHHLQPMTDVFVAKYKGQVVYTATLVTDDMNGLPMESIFPAEVAGLRRDRGTLAEVSCLAGRDRDFDRKQGFQVYLNLIALLLQFSRQNEVDRVLLAVHPRHARFYERFFGCESFGEKKAYSAVLDNPAVPCVHEFAKLNESGYKLFDQVYGLPFLRWELLRQPMPTSDREYFRSAIDTNAPQMAIPMAA